MKCNASSITATIHNLKTWPEFFEALADGRKRFEIRKDDRGFEVGDVLHLIEWEPKSQTTTGRCLLFSVAYITEWEQVNGNVVMGITPVEEPTP